MKHTTLTDKKIIVDCIIVKREKQKTKTKSMRANRAPGIEHSKGPRWRAKADVGIRQKLIKLPEIVDFLMCPFIGI